MRVNSTRPAAVAGTWYPGIRGALTRDVDGYLDAVGPGRDPARAARRRHRAARRPDVLGSGRRLRLQGGGGACGPFDDAIVLVGPSHFVAFDGVALYPSGGVRRRRSAPAPIDEALGARADGGVAADPRAARRAPARTLARDAAAVHPPPAPGRGDRPAAHGLPDARDDRGAWRRRSAQVAPERRVLLVASTDLSHYFDATDREAARRARRRTAWRRAIPKRLLRYLRGVPRSGARTLRRLRRRSGDCGDAGGAGAGRATTARVLKYMHSGQISGDNSGVVGYLAGRFGRFTDVH